MFLSEGKRSKNKTVSCALTVNIPLAPEHWGREHESRRSCCVCFSESLKDHHGREEAQAPLSERERPDGNREMGFSCRWSRGTLYAVSSQIRRTTVGLLRKT